jgi:hypothetical protein
MSNVTLLKSLERTIIIKFMSGYSKKSISEQFALPKEHVDKVIQENFGIKPRKQGEKNGNNN